MADLKVPISQDSQRSATSQGPVSGPRVPLSPIFLMMAAADVHKQDRFFEQKAPANERP